MGQTNSRVKSSSAACDVGPTYGVNGPEAKTNLGVHNEDTGQTLTCCCVSKTKKKNFSVIFL